MIDQLNTTPRTERHRQWGSGGGHPAGHAGPPRRAALHRPDPTARIPRLPRRLLERFAECPFQGWAVETGRSRTASAAAAAGGQVHRAIARAIRAHLEDGADPARCLARLIAGARPDVQADASAALRRGIHAIGDFLASLPPSAIIAHRGGRGHTSGRLARDVLTRPPVRITSTADLIYAAPDPREVHEIDFRSGHTILTASDVRASLKFRVHAWCLFAAWGDLAAHHVRVWHTRTNALTPPVTFTPADAALADAAIVRIIRIRRDAFAALGRHADAAPKIIARVRAARPRDFWWPAPAKCAACPACTACPAALAPARDLAADPEAFLRDTAALQAALDQRIRLLRQTVRRTGRDLVFDGIAFGTRKPRRPVNPVAAFYEPVAAEGGRAE